MAFKIKAFKNCFFCYELTSQATELHCMFISSVDAKQVLISTFLLALHKVSCTALLSLCISVFWRLMQEYLRLSDVFKMYGNVPMQPHSPSPATLHCLSLTVTPALSCEVETLLLFIF